MSAQVLCADEGPIVRVTLSNPGKLNAMSRAMWAGLRAVFERVPARTECRCVVLQGGGGAFCAGGDIVEYPAFRFDVAGLRAFHEGLVWPALQALLACEVPVIAAIEGPCMGAGMEMASACDIRLATVDARFGAPIAKLGFPMAPREAALVARVAGEATAREMLLQAAVLDAAEMKARGFLHQVLAADALAAEVQTRAARIATLAPQAARLNKRTLRALNPLDAPTDEAQQAIESIVPSAYDYADSAEHREGIAAFLAKRPARF